LCVLSQSVKTDESFSEARDQWVRDIHSFKDKCRDPLVQK